MMCYLKAVFSPDHSSLISLCACLMLCLQLAQIR